MADPERTPTRGWRVGRNVANLRRDAGKTQEELALLLPLSVRTLRRIETGHLAPDLDVLIGLCRVLGAPLAEVLRGIDGADLDVLGVPRR